MQRSTGDPLDPVPRYWDRLATAVRTVRSRLPLILSGVLIAGAAPPENLQEALQAQRSLVAQNPTDADRLNDLGNLLALARDLDGAEDAYRRALQIDPNSTTSLYNMALVLQEQGKTKLARQALHSILQIDPDHAWGHYQLGTLYDSQNNRAKAVHHYERAFSLDRSLVDPQVNPHIVENRLVTDALLQMYVADSPSTQAPRLYREPGHVADLLLPAEAQKADAVEAPDLDSAAAAERISRQYRATSQPRAGVSRAWESTANADELDVDDDSPDRNLDEGDLRAVGADSTAGSPPGWSGTSTTLRPEEDEGSTFGQNLAPAGVAASPPVRRITSENLRTTDEPEGQPDPFVPGTESTGRLDIELLPAADSSSTVPAS